MIFSFFQDFCPFGSSRMQTFANDVPHGYASFKHICNVIIGYVNGIIVNKSMLDLYKKLESQEREKREKMDSK